MVHLLKLKSHARDNISSSSSSDEEFRLGKKLRMMAWDGITAGCGQKRLSATRNGCYGSNDYHHVSHAWVVKDDYSLVGVVMFTDILREFRSIAQNRICRSHNTKFRYSSSYKLSLYL